jgi:Ca-activated chloride channel family protein
MKYLAYLVVACACWLVSPQMAAAELPSWLRTQNGHIEDGNALLAKGDAKSALAEYDKAARQLPEDTGVQLDRGLALLKIGELAKAREALVSATGGSGSPCVRADAYQNLALAFYRDGDALAGQKKHEEAQHMFQEALDAAKRSLRLRPGDASAAWNLELAARRLREEKARKQAEDDKKNQDQKDDQKKNDKDQQQQDPSANKDQQKPGDQGKQPDKQADAKNDAQKPPQPPTDKDKQAAQQKPQEAKAADAKQGDGEKGEEKPLPKDVEQALDSLKDGEQNFERLRARQRAAQENRAPEKDW